MQLNFFVWRLWENQGSLKNGQVTPAIVWSDSYWIRAFAFGFCFGNQTDVWREIFHFEVLLKYNDKQKLGYSYLV